MLLPKLSLGQKEKVLETVHDDPRKNGKLTEHHQDSEEC